MDVKFQRMLIEKSLAVAADQQSESLKDFFIGQAARQQAKLDQYLAETKRSKHVRSKRRLGSN